MTRPGYRLIIRPDPSQRPATQFILQDHNGVPISVNTAALSNDFLIDHILAGHSLVIYYENARAGMVVDYGGNNG